MDPSQAVAQSLTNAELAGLLALAVTVIGVLIGVIYNGIMRAIEELKELFQGHVEDDKQLAERVDNHAQRLAILDGEKE